MNTPTRDNHPRLGYSIGRRVANPMVHVIRPGRVWTLKDRDYQERPGQLACTWQCHGQQNWAGPVVFLDSVPAGMRKCARCDVDQIQTVPEVVYLVDGGHAYKVGWTTALTVRVAALRGELLAFKPGGRRDERVLISAMSDVTLPGKREWLHRTPQTLSRLAEHFPTLAVA